MKFCSLVLELHLPQNFCHTHTDTQTYRHNTQIQTQSKKIVDFAKFTLNFFSMFLSSTFIVYSKIWKKFSICQTRPKYEISLYYLCPFDDIIVGRFSLAHTYVCIFTDQYLKKQFFEFRRFYNA